MSIVIIAKNNTASEIFIEDLGIGIPASSQVTLTDYFSISEVSDSPDLYAQVNNENITINDGSNDLNKTEGLDWITLENIQVAHGLDDHTDIPTKPISGDKMLEIQDGTATWIDSISGAEKQSISWTQSPSHNGDLTLLGWHTQTDIGASLSSGSPINASDSGYHSHFVVDVSNGSGLPFTIRITGISIDESTGATTSSDTEDIIISTNGFYQSVKSWLDNVQLSIVEASKSCNVDIYKTTYWDRGNKDFTIEGARLEWEPDSTTWAIRMLLYHINDTGEKVVIDNTELSSTNPIERGDSGQLSKYKRGDYNTVISGSGKEGIVVLLEQQNIRSFFLEVKYSV